MMFRTPRQSTPRKSAGGWQPWSMLLRKRVDTPCGGVKGITLVRRLYARSDSLY